MIEQTSAYITEGEARFRKFWEDFSKDCEISALRNYGFMDRHRKS